MVAVHQDAEVPYVSNEEKISGDVEVNVNSVVEKEEKTKKK